MEVWFEETCLRVHTDGTIERLHKQTKKGWTIVKGSNNNGYLLIGIDKKKYLMHRIIAYVYLNHELDDYTKEIDHINRVKNDNCVENLRIVTKSQNQINRDSVENAKGYSKTYNGFQAQFRLNGKQLRKTFKTEEEARTQYLEWIKEYR